MTTLGLLKINVYLNKDYDVIISYSRNLDCIVGVVM